METADTVRQAARPQDFMCTLELNDAYFQILFHPSSRKYLRIIHDNRQYQFKVLCIDLSTAPQVFMRVFALVSFGTHRICIRLLRYLDDWLILTDLVATLLQLRDRLLAFCQDLGSW
ncbi:uncharacterized protein [Palaemon carinicauda]|uniref:uncharacterized protein n=1 Tax=Palaemon carinicauda TaxID=392227 RepID=UPI0035B6AB10